METPAYFATIRGDHGHRQRTAELAAALLMTSVRFAEQSASLREGIVIGCERGAFNRTIELTQTKPNRIVSWLTMEFVQTYLHQRQILCERIKDIATNPSLEDKIVTKKIDWSRLTTEPIHKLLSGVFEAAAAAIESRKPIQIEVTYDGPPCPNCHSEKTKRKSQQTGSADESSASFVLCYNCGREFSRQS